MKNALLASTGVLVIALIALSIWGLGEQKARKEALGTLSERTVWYESELEKLRTTLLESEESGKQAAEALDAERRRNEEFEKRISGIQSTVSVLEKLQFTDPELLMKYSKVYFLSENYFPSDLARIPSEYSYPEDKAMEFHARALPYLTRLLKAAREEGVDLRVASAYRSFGTQAALKSGYTVTYGTGANRFSADQGYSEHQLGTTIDFTTVALGGSLAGFDTTPAYIWLKENAQKYGFVLSYPEGNTFYQYEPWHWRFVGEDLARDLKRSDKRLYDLTQRELDAYLVSIFD